ncbi:MAG: DMT family transporter [bacterium]|nr:DMT family transporter [bacterium]
MRKNLLPYVLLLITSIIWGIVGPIIKNTLFYVEPVTLLFWRFVFTVAFVLPFFIFYLYKNPIKLSWIPKLIAIGVLGGVLPLILVFNGFKLTSSIEGTLIASVSPLLVAIGAAFFLKEKLLKRELVGISLAIAGTVFVAIEPFFQSGLKGDDRVLGNILILLYALSWASSVVLVKEWKGQHIRPFHITSTSFIVCLIAFTPLAFLEAGGFPRVDFSNFNILGGLLYMSILSSTVAYTLYYIALEKVHAAQADIFNYLQPVFAIPLSILWLNEKLTPFIIMGMLLIISGVGVAEYHARKRRAKVV